MANTVGEEGYKLGENQNDQPQDDDDKTEGLEYDGGAPPDAFGWHSGFPLPRGPHKTVLLHDGDLEFKDKGIMPLGIRGPEKFIWGQHPEDLLWAEYVSLSF